jgi:hypothetical protein
MPGPGCTKVSWNIREDSVSLQFVIESIDGDLKCCLHAGNTELNALQQEGPTGIRGHQIAMRVIGRKTKQKPRKLRKHWRINVLFSAGFVKYWFLHTWFVWGLAKPGSFEAILAVMIHHLYTCNSHVYIFLVTWTSILPVWRLERSSCYFGKTQAKIHYQRVVL